MLVIQQVLPLRLGLRVHPALGYVNKNNRDSITEITKMHAKCSWIDTFVILGYFRLQKDKQECSICIFMHINKCRNTTKPILILGDFNKVDDDILKTAPQSTFGAL